MPSRLDYMLQGLPFGNEEVYRFLTESYTSSSGSNSSTLSSLQEMVQPGPFRELSR